ncbi:MAG: TorF family putative porin [Polaromonas sp.]|jgi:uncharacterized protein (TIGR02001 family)
MKFAPAQVTLAVLVALSGSAFAQTAAPAVDPISYNISAVSNYKYRGQDQDTSKTRGFKPALQGGVDYAHSSGFYVGNWNSTVNFMSSGDKANVEVDLYGGYKFPLGDVGMDVGALTYIYPGATKANTTELYAAASYGPLTAKYSSTVSKGYFGVGESSSNGRGTGYLNLAFAQEVMPKVTLKASVGSTMFTTEGKAAGGFNYVDYNVGAAYDLGEGMSVTGFYAGGNKKNSFNYNPEGSTKSLNSGTFIVMLTKAI